MSDNSFLTAFASVGVGVGVGDQEVGRMEEGSAEFKSTDLHFKLSSPTKNQKKPSGCLTGTPSSAQRPLKIRQLSTSTPVKAIDFCHVTTHAATASPDIDTGRILLPPDITLMPSNFEVGMPVVRKPDIHARNIEQSNTVAAVQPISRHSQADAEQSFYSSVTDHVKSRFKGFQFKQAIPVMLGVVPGFKRSMSAAEIKAKDKILQGDLWSIQVNRCPDIPIADGMKTQVRTRGFNGKKNRGVEEIARYYCSAKDCKCVVSIARIASGILAYEQIDLTTNLPYNHSGHDILHETTKSDRYSLTHAQKVYVMNDGAVLLQCCAWKSLAEAMIADPFVCVHYSQASDKHTFAQRIEYYANRMKAKGAVQAIDKRMKGLHIQGILEHLQQPHRSDLPEDHIIPFTKTDDFNCLWRNILVSDHDYNASGGVFDYICVEYIDSIARAQKAVDMFRDDGVQGEMDFFHVPGVGADWQVGHIGFSDHNHRYFILCMIICHSENSKSAGLLINRAISLIHGCGGKLTRILVDGGTALNKAIGDENEQNKFLAKYSIQKRRCFAHIIRMVSFTVLFHLLCHGKLTAK